MDGLIIISALLLGGFALAALSKPRTMDGMEDTPVSIDNIRRGVANGWYTCALVMVDGIPAVHLSGRTSDGKQYSDVYPITQEDWNTLKAEGYKVEL